MERDWRELDEHEYAAAVLEVVRSEVALLAERDDRYRWIAGDPTVEGSPPRLVLPVADDGGGRYERRFDVQVGVQPPFTARHLVRDAVARLPDCERDEPRSYEEARRDLLSLGWAREPWAASATLHRDGLDAVTVAGPVAVRPGRGDGGEVWVGDRALFAHEERAFRSASLWSCDGTLFRLCLAFDWGHVELRDL